MKSFLAVVALLLAASASAQLSPRFPAWPDDPVRHLMTKQELKQWKELKSDDEADAFFDLFWAKRDPTADTPKNEFREEYEARVAFADDQFSNGRERGALTDPGRVIILLGPPYTIGGRAGAPAVSSLGPVPARAPTDAQGAVLVPSPVRESNRQVWTYAHERKPSYIPQTDFVFLFLDEGHNDWKLAYTERTNPDVILQEAVIGLIRSPKLTKAPFRADVSFARPRKKIFHDLFLETSYKEFKTADKSAAGTANLTWGEFVTADGQHFVSAQLYVPAGGKIAAGQKVNFFSVVENAAGEVVDVDELATVMTALGTDAYAEKSIPLAPGSYVTTFGLGVDGQIVAAARVPMNVEKLDPAAPGISSLYLASSIVPLTGAFAAMDPFTFGGLKVIPKGDLQFTTSGDLWYFVELRNPGVSAQAPKIQVAIDIEGQTAKGPAEMKFPMADAKAVPLKGSNNRYVLGLAIPLEGFIPGDYTMRLHVVDTVLGKKYDLAKDFRVRPSS